MLFRPDHNGSIRVTQMFSYPKDELKKILDDEKFVATLDSNEKQYHFGKTSPVDEK